jgi:hypothetical protein
MSRMGRLAIEIDEVGIDYSQVDLDVVVAYREAYKQKTGQDMRLIDAIRELYGVKGNN